MTGLGYICTLLDIFLRTSRVQDLWLQSLHLPLIVMSLGLMALVFSGRIFHFLYSPLGRMLAAFTMWALVAVGVSVWPGGAYSYLMDVWIPVLPAFVLLCGFVRTFEHLRKAILVTAFGYATVVVVAFVFQVDVGVERIGVGGDVDYSLGDANELAMIVLMGLPLWTWTVMDKRSPVLLKLYVVACGLLSVPLFFRTGSRSGLLTLGVVLVYVLYRQSMAVRLKFVLAIAIAIPAGLALTPRMVLARYATILSTFGEANDPIADPAPPDGEPGSEQAVASAQASTAGRIELFKKGVLVTLSNPLLGVGPGMFVVAENDMAVADGRRRGYWKASHNAYVQISADLGIPALILYVMILLRIWRILSRGEAADPRAFSFARQLRSLAFSLKILVLVVASAGMTLSIGYGPYVPYLCGIAVVIERILAGYRGALSSAEPSKAAEGAPSLGRPEPAMVRGALPAPRGAV